MKGYEEQLKKKLTTGCVLKKTVMHKLNESSIYVTCAI